MNNVFKLIIRNFTGNPFTNLINLLGLAVSLALVIILSVYCYSEFTTDAFHKNGENIYLVGQDEQTVHTPAILKDHIDQKIPNIKASVRISSTWETPVFQFENNAPLSSDLIFADAEFFDLFTYKSTQGNLAEAFNNPMSVVIKSTLATKLFGDTPAIGKKIKLNNNHELTVAAVIDEPKTNSSLRFSAITSIEARKKIQPSSPEEYTNWGWSNFQTYVLLHDKVNIEETSLGINSLFPKDRAHNISSAILLPFSDLYFSKLKLHGHYFLSYGDKNKVLILALVAFLVLIIALINFINISSSQWIQKIKQTGVMKVIGAGRSTIFKYAIFETFLFFTIASLLATLLVFLIYPFIHTYTGVYFNYQQFYLFHIAVLFIPVVFVLSVAVGFLPALRISSSKTVDNLKKKVSSTSTNYSAKGILVSAQFIITIVLISFTLLVQKQVQFGSTNIDFKQSNIVGIKLTQQLADKKEVLRKQLLEKPGIDNISFSSYYPGKEISNWRIELNDNGMNKQAQFHNFCADASFTKMFDLELVEGRLFSDDLMADQRKMIVNEEFVRKHNITNPIGLTINPGVELEIIGVVKDFHFKSINHAIAPLAIRNEPYTSYCLVNIEALTFNQLNMLVKEIRKTTSELSPAFPVEISFMDQAVEQMYHSELMFRKTFSLFSFCAIVISCLGILAMSLFACQRRIKEIGVRKVNGAKVSEIIQMLNQDFLKWVVLAFIAACPVGYYAMKIWLQKFAYQTEISWWIFAYAGGITLGITLLTISFQTWQVARRNPVEALRYE